MNYGKIIDFLSLFGKFGENIISILKRIWVKLFISQELTPEIEQAGKAILDDIRRFQTEYDEIWVASQGVGDTVILLSFCDAIKQQHNIGKMLIVLKKTHESLSRIFDCEAAYYVIPDDKMFFLKEYMVRSRILTYENIYTQIFDIWQDSIYQKEKGMLERYKRYVFHIDADTIQKGLAIQPETESKYCRSVLLMPYSYTLQISDDRFWEELANVLINKGYKVYTNLGPRDEKGVVKNTEPLFLNMYELAKVVKNFELLIGARSGICDLLSLTEAKLACIYPYKQYIEEWDESYFWSNENIKAYVYSKHRKKIISSILNDFNL